MIKKKSLRKRKVNKKGFDNVARCSIYTMIFYGYASGRQLIEPGTPVNRMAVDFIDEFDLGDILDAKVIQVSHIGFTNLLFNVEGNNN